MHINIWSPVVRFQLICVITVDGLDNGDRGDEKRQAWRARPNNLISFSNAAAIDVHFSIYENNIDSFSVLPGILCSSCVT